MVAVIAAEVVAEVAAKGAGKVVVVLRVAGWWWAVVVGVVVDGECEGENGNGNGNGNGTQTTEKKLFTSGPPARRTPAWGSPAGRRVRRWLSTAKEEHVCAHV